MVNNMNKLKSYAFGKNVYLLGSDEDGTWYWLEEASWDCGWYWGFGYIETYTNNKNPMVSKDIKSHQHADNFYLEWWRGDKPILRDTTFNEKEGWELTELLKQFYILRESAEYFDRGKANMADTKIKLYKKSELVEEINKVRMPIIFNRIYEILSPNSLERK